MKKPIKNYVVLLVILIFSTSVFGQTSENIEKELLGLYKKVQNNSAYKADSDFDLLQKANEDFKQKFLQYTKTASTLKYDFPKLKEEISIETSDDGKFRVYSWDTLSGGTMHFFETIYQFQGANGKVYSTSRDLAEGDSGSFVYDVFTADSKAGKIYLACSVSIGSTQDRFQNLRLFKIDGNSLNDAVKLIKTKTGLTDSIGFEYNFFSVVDRPERQIELILYDKKTQTFKIPVVIDDKEFPNGRVTNKFINYRFDGTYFVKVK
ncbi:MAG: hypothetical protein ABI891_06090 [Acidobacteriota bacterium]